MGPRERECVPELPVRSNALAVDMKASIIIPCHNRSDDVAELLTSLDVDTLAVLGVEVIVADDGSTDGTATMVQREFPGVRVLTSAVNMGPARTRNRAAAAARGPLLLYLDSDGAVAPGWLEAMLGHDDGRTVLLGNVVDFEGGRVQSVPRRATFLGKSLRCRPERANSGPSCNLGIPKACFEALGGFDEDIPYYFEDSDLCIRARHAGCGFAFVADAVFRHKGVERKRGDAVRMQERNSVYAMLKAYAGRPLHTTAFVILNTGWFALRLLTWGLCGRWGDCRRLVRGFIEGHRAFLHRNS